MELRGAAEYLYTLRLSFYCCKCRILSDLRQKKISNFFYFSLAKCFLGDILKTETQEKILNNGKRKRVDRRKKDKKSAPEVLQHFRSG